ncbi:MAG: hypothetical protein COS84_09300 [Armatimonadetes bacterium CG07_land_8_20_14_0_80_40_9]|nr:MAG: hypothetical protein COS84_09300 [Armatimonadetes bacterium CG07_land_8_20_14_0_80_40_9]
MMIAKILEAVALISIVFGIVLTIVGRGVPLFGLDPGSYLKFSAICLAFAIALMMNQLVGKEK